MGESGHLEEHGLPSNFWRKGRVVAGQGSEQGDLTGVLVWEWKHSYRKCWLAREGWSRALGTHSTVPQFLHGEQKQKGLLCHRVVPK